MTLAISSPEDLVNVALGRIGFKASISNIFEGSLAANLALNIYAQTRDELLRQSDWGFAERNLIMSLLKQAPAGGYIPGVTTWDPALYPPVPWLFEYSYPNDCLKVRALKNVPLFIPNFDPQPYVFRIVNDNAFTPPQKVILCNVPPDAALVYTAQVTNPLTWEADFTEALAAAVARRLAPALDDLNAAQMEAADEMRSKAVAQVEQG